MRLQCIKCTFNGAFWEVQLTPTSLCIQPMYMSVFQREWDVQKTHLLLLMEGRLYFRGLPPRDCRGTDCGITIRLQEYWTSRLLAQEDSLEHMSPAWFLHLNGSSGNGPGSSSCSCSSSAVAVNRTSILTHPSSFPKHLPAICSDCQTHILCVNTCIHACTWTHAYTHTVWWAQTDAEC